MSHTRKSENNGNTSESVRSAILALYTMNFLASSSTGAFYVIVPLYMRDLGVSFVGLGLAFSVFGMVMGVARAEREELT